MINVADLVVSGLPLWGLCLLLAAAAALGEWVFRALGWPRITGYAACGLLLGAAGGGADSLLSDPWLRLVIDLALGVLLFDLGARVNVSWLRRNRRLAALVLADALLIGLLLTGLLVGVGVALLPALMAAAILTLSSGVVVGRVVAEQDARGQVCERVLLLAASGTVLGVILTSSIELWAGFSQAHAVAPAHAGPVKAWLLTVPGSMLAAGLLAGVFALALRLRIDTRSEGVALVLLALLGAAMGLGRELGLSTVLLPLLAGMFLRRWHEGPVLWPRQFGLLGSALTLVLFVVVGSAWTPGLLGPVVLLACAVLLVRQLGKMALSAVFGHGSGLDRRQMLSQGLGLAPISGTALVLLADTHHRQPELMAPVAALIMACIVVMELLGPLAVAMALRLAGESHSSPSDGRPS